MQCTELKQTDRNVFFTDTQSAATQKTAARILESDLYHASLPFPKHLCTQGCRLLKAVLIV